MSFSAIMALGAAVIILLTGFRVYLLDRAKYQYQAFLVLSCLLAWKCFCWYEIEQTSQLSVAVYWRKLQSVRVFCFPMLLYCCWRFARPHLQRIALGFKILFIALALTPAFVFWVLDVFAGLGHGTIVLLENGNWGLKFHYTGELKIIRSAWVISIYALSWYFVLVVWRKETLSFRKIRLTVLQILLLMILCITIYQNYLISLSGMVLPVNESWTALILIALLGWAISDFQLFELKPESAFAHVSHSMSNLLIITDTNFHIKNINPTALAFFGTSPRYTQNTPLKKVVGEITATLLMHNLGQGNKQEIIFPLPDKEARILFTTSLLLNRRGGLLGYVFVGNDLTDYYQALEEVKRYNTRLENSNQSLERFAYVVSHDLKEPLRTINGFITLLDRKMAAYEEEDIREYMGYINRGTVRMNALINSILTISRLGNEQEEEEYVSLEKIVLEIDDKLRALRYQKNAVLHYDAGSLPVIRGKYYQISLLFQNLIENGIKYNISPVPRLRLTHRKVLNGYEFSVEDNGIGIEQKYYKQVFQMFKRLHSWAEYEGTGIGLTICQKIVEDLGGRIWIEAPANGGGGTVFKFFLPLTETTTTLQKANLGTCVSE